MRRLALLALLAVLAWSAVWPASAESPARQRVARINGGWPIDDFTLIDQRGTPFTRQQLRGRWTLVLFGDTHCGEPCTTVLSALRGMSERIAPTQKLKTTQVLFISLGGDTPADLARYLAPFDKRFVGVSGSPAAIERLADDLGVAETLPVPGESESTHVLVLVDPEAVVWGQFLPPFDAMMLTARYLKTRVGR